MRAHVIDLDTVVRVGSARVLHRGPRPPIPRHVEPETVPIPRETLAECAAAWRRKYGEAA